MTTKKWTVGYDGPSRPIILGPKGSMYSISKFRDGRWGSFDGEEVICQYLCDQLNDMQSVMEVVGEEDWTA